MGVEAHRGLAYNPMIVFVEGVPPRFCALHGWGHMFARESEMTRPAASWLRSNGMTVKSEFVTPWGVCDLVGLSFNRDNVASRLDRRQTKAVGSITRALLLLRIPDVETGKSTTLRSLVRQCTPSIPEQIVSAETDRLVTDRFVTRSSRGWLQRVNGWMPLHQRLVAVELKLSRIEEAMRQALDNLGFAEESYVGLPSKVARRVASSPSRWSAFFGSGVGLLSVGQRRCRVLVPARRTHDWTDQAVQFYCVEKFWRTRVRDN